MKRLRIGEVEHGVVMSSPGCARIPGTEKSVAAMGLRGQHYGWPGICRTRDGDILVSASERIRHVDPYGRTVVARAYYMVPGPETPGYDSMDMSQTGILWSRVRIKQD